VNAEDFAGSARTRDRTEVDLQKLLMPEFEPEVASVTLACGLCVESEKLHKRVSATRSLHALDYIRVGPRNTGHATSLFVSRSSSPSVVSVRRPFSLSLHPPMAQFIEALLEPSQPELVHRLPRSGCSPAPHQSFPELMNDPRSSLHS
jgi:hypothetical protein